jgi:60 kDa SS-A/Ro ribonucleoprotein
LELTSQKVSAILSEISKITTNAEADYILTIDREKVSSIPCRRIILVRNKEGESEMANKMIFKAGPIPSCTAVTYNNAGGMAYQMSAKHALAQYAATGTFGSTFYMSAQMQLEKVLEHLQYVDSPYIAKLAVYSREQGRMKDMPAFLCAALTARGGQDDIRLLKRIFGRAINNEKMLRNYVQIVRAGTLGRKSFGTAPQRVIREWMNARTDHQLFRGSVGNNPSMADVIKMVHPKPVTLSRNALYAYMIGKPYEFSQLPPLVQQFEQYKMSKEGEVPNVPFEMLTALGLGTSEWTTIARNAGWQMTRMNLNTFARHGVFENHEMVDIIADRLNNRDEIMRSGNFPYQIFTAFKATAGNSSVPHKVIDALATAADVACDNVPEYGDFRIVVCPDVSGSMRNPVIGDQESRRGRVLNHDVLPRCVDVAGLISSAIIRKNPHARIIPFEGRVVNVDVSAKNSLLKNTQILAGVGGGSTNCSAPLELLNREKAQVDLVIFVSDYESWIDSARGNRWNGTAMLHEWNILKKYNPNARLICIDLTPNDTGQVPNRKDIINVGGFSDFIFDLISLYLSGKLDDQEQWVSYIEAIEI